MTPRFMIGASITLDFALSLLEECEIGAGIEVRFKFKL
jgi:hypothetical protein